MSRGYNAGNLTVSPSSVLTVTDGNGVLLNDASIQINQAGSSQDGYLSSTDWNKFNNAVGGGTVLSVSVNTANGFSGVVTNPTTTPAITLSTSVTGILKGNGSSINASIPGTDYSTGTSSLGTGILKSTTGTGDLSIAVASDFPILNQNTMGNAATATTANNVSGVVGITNGGTGASTANNALNALLPSQAGNANKILQTDGNNASWQTSPGDLVTSVNGQTGAVSLGINNMNDAAISSVSDAQVLIYNISSGKWTNATLSGGFTVLDTGVTTLTNSAVTSQVLTGLTPVSGNILATDSILTAMNKIAFNIVAPSSTTIHKNSNYQMTVADTKIIMDANGITVTLPDATQVVVGQTYTLKLGTGALTGTLLPYSGQTLDGGGGITISGAYDSLSAFSDGFNWFAC